MRADEGRVPLIDYEELQGSYERLRQDHDVVEAERDDLRGQIQALRERVLAQDARVANLEALAQEMERRSLMSADARVRELTAENERLTGIVATQRRLLNAA